MVQNLRSRLSQAAAYPGLVVFTRINSSFHVLCIFSRINGPNGCLQQMKSIQKNIVQQMGVWKIMFKRRGKLR